MTEPTRNRFIPCPGGILPQPAHAPTVFIECRPCKNNAVTGWCLICGFRFFGKSEYWLQNGLTRRQVLDACPIAVTGKGQPV